MADARSDGVSNQRLSGARCLASGIDALYLSGRGSLAPEVRGHLEELRTWAAESGSPVPVRVAGEEFLVSPHSFGKYRFRLAHENGLIGITPSDHLPTLRIQPWAEFLHGVGCESALTFFESMGPRLIHGDVRWGLSRMDLFCDVQGWLVDGDDRRNFICRGSRLDTHEEGTSFTGLEFGRRTSGTVCGRIYDKTLQIEQKGLDWWHGVWGDDFDPALPVLRVEFEVGRTGLSEFGVRTPRDGLDCAPAIWANVTSDWLTYRTPSADQTKARWRVAPEWERVQNAPLRGDAAGLERVRAGARSGDLRRLMPQLVGYLATAGAILDLDDIRSVLGAVRELVSQDEDRVGVTFEQRVAAKVAERRPA